MKSKRLEELQQLDKMTPEEERAYFDAQDPFLQGKGGRVLHPRGPADRMGYFALRIGGEDIDRLADLAKKRGMKLSELARALILQGLDQAEGQPDLEGRVAALEKELAGIRPRLAALQDKALAKVK